MSTKTKKIVVIKPHERWAYSVGDVGVVPADKAEKLIKLGYWKEVDNEQKQASDSDGSTKRTTNANSSKKAPKD
jgi:hypothetical protein